MAVALKHPERSKNMNELTIVEICANKFFYNWPERVEENLKNGVTNVILKNFHYNFHIDESEELAKRYGYKCRISRNCLFFLKAQFLPLQ